MDILYLSDNLNFKDDDVIRKFEDSIKLVDGRYQVELPWNENADSLTDNHANSEGRFRTLIKRFKRNPSFLNQYNEIISKHIREGIAEKVDLNTGSDARKIYYMPHQAVVREDKLTTKMRIVFDASSCEPNSFSLNHCLNSGPNLTPDLLALLLQFRVNRVALTADIEAAFLQIMLAPEDRDAVRFLWIKNDKDMEPEILRMTRVIFGARSSPFLLNATIKHHIKKYEQEYPTAFHILNNKLYVDDLIHSLGNEQLAFNIHQQVKFILKEAGFNMRKWRTNIQTLQDKFNEGSFCDSETCKTLGYCWNSKKDLLSLDSEKLTRKKNVHEFGFSKRDVIRTAGKVFDPMGLLSPFTVRAKMILQDIWERKLNWDDALPADMKKEWEKWCDELELLNNIEIPRYYFETCEITNDVQIHCFVDASKKAYGAIIYLRYIDGKGRIYTTFVCSKSRVAPLQKLTLPRLELLAAVIGSRLCEYVKNNLSNLRDCQVRFWTDSMIVLHWIRRSSRNLKIFIQNRVSEIRSKTDGSFWSHCPGKENPADLLTRGETLRHLQDNELWWKGPKWLSKDEGYWPKEKLEDFDAVSDSEEVKKSAVFIIGTKPEAIMNIERFGHLTKLLRVTAWIKRFIFNLKNKVNRKFGTLTTEELHTAEVYWIQKTQEETFKEELEELEKGREIPLDSKLKNFNVLLDAENIIRLKSRLQHADITYEEAFPILLPDRSHFSNLVICRSHERTAHAGVAETLTDVREKFWIVRGRQRIKSFIYNCNLCKKFRAKPFTQYQAPLPADRIKETHPFEVTGIDYAGPLYVKHADETKKAYVLLFTCAVTRAVHLELTPDLTTQTFLQAFRKFIGRRGICSTIYSDNAKTFLRAKQDLNNLWKIIEKEEVQNLFGKLSIKWKFIAERAPWWGGFWERLVRSVKMSLRRVLGRASVSYQEMEVILVEVEALLNSRPLTYVYSDPREPGPLTPGHFLIGRRLLTLPQGGKEAPSSESSLLKRRRYQELLLNRVWKRWQSSYLLELRSAHRSNPLKEPVDIKENTVVLIKDNTPRLCWKMGIISQIHPGRDGRTRACTLRLPNGTFLRRPVQLLCPLELSSPL